MTSKPVTFWLHYNRFGAKRTAKDVWTVHTSKKCHPAKKVIVCVPVETIYRGDTAPQPRAYLRGVGVIKVGKDGLVEIV